MGKVGPLGHFGHFGHALIIGVIGALRDESDTSDISCEAGRLRTFGALCAFRTFTRLAPASNVRSTRANATTLPRGPASEHWRGTRAGLRLGLDISLDVWIRSSRTCVRRTCVRPTALAPIRHRPARADYAGLREH